MATTEAGKDLVRKAFVYREKENFIAFMLRGREKGD